MKQAKKVVSLLMALTMLIGLMTAVTVNAEVVDYEVVKTINFDDYEVRTEFDSYNDIYTHCKADIVENAEDSSDHELLVYGLNSAGTQHRFNIKGLPLEEGETYKMTFYAKANVPTGIAVNMNTFSGGVKYIGSTALSNDWQPFEIEYTATETTTSGVIVLCTNALTAPNVNQTWIDDIVFSKKVIKPEVTVNVGKGGTVTYGSETVSESETFAVNNGADVTLTVAPESGKYATATVDGVAKEIVNNQITLEDVSADTTVKVLFTENGWENVLYINFDGFGAISDLPQNTADGNRTTVAVTDAVINSTVSQTTFATTSGRVFNLPAIDWESGATYRLSYDVKASKDGIRLAPGVTIAGYSDGNKSVGFNANGTTNPTLTTTWQPVEQQANIPEFTNGNTSFSNQMYVNATGGQAGDIIYFDNFRIEKKVPVTESDVTVTANEGGSVTYEGNPVEAITVANGTEVTLTAVPTEGYSISAITVDGEAVEHDNGAFTFTVDADTAVDVTFAKITNNVTVTAGVGGTVNYDGAAVEAPIAVEYGESVELTIVPDEGYDIATVTVGGETVEPTEVGVITVNNVIAATDVNVTFVKETRTVTVTATEGGSVTYEGAAAPESFTVEYGTEVTLVVTPDANYEVAVEVNDNTVVPNASNEVTFTVTENTAVSVTFTEKAPVLAEIAATTATFNATHEGKPAVFVYNKLNAFTQGEGAYYGIKLWNAANPEAVVELKAHGLDGQPATAVAGAQFAIRAFGDAIVAGEEYGIQAFVGDVLGEVKTGTIE